MTFLLALATCLPVSGEHITGKDLAQAESAFSALPETRIVSYAPAPGRQRIFTVHELRSIAESAGIAAEPAGDLCFELPVAPLREEEVLDSMRKSYPDAKIEIVETSRFPVPAGAVFFPTTGLQRSSSSPLIWRGYVSYGVDRKFSIWAKVNLKIRATRVLATEALRAGQVIQPEQLRVEEYEGPPLDPGFAVDPEQVAGRMLRSFVAAGAAFKISNLQAPWDIERGDSVTVQVYSGAARITVQAKATSSGRRGETVQLLNESSGKQFRAKVESAGLAIVR